MQRDGLQGESVEYYRPDNSLLPYVLTARTGIPISLAITHAAVARRAVRVGRGVLVLVPLSATSHVLACKLRCCIRAALRAL